jgi:hypothetical protein
MRIAYVTSDEVNQAAAVAMAELYGAAVSVLRPEDLSAPDGYDAVLYDLDGVPPREWPSLLEGLRSGPPVCPKALHGYGLTEEQAQALRLRGVAVAQRLNRALVRTLCRSVLRDLKAVPPDDAVTDLTWIDLAR